MAAIIIKHPNGTYFKCWTPIGPCFGATRDEAHRFDDDYDARREMGTHWGFVGCEVECLPEASKGNG